MKDEEELTAKLEEISDELECSKSDISELQDTVEYLDNSFDAYKEHIERMVNQLSNSIYELNKRVDNLFDVLGGKKSEEPQKSLKYKQYPPHRIDDPMWFDPSRYVK